MNYSFDFPYPSRRMPVFARNVVATSHPLAAQAGLSMLSAGGNAVDAALASAITLTVVEPTGNGIGGDAFALVWDGHRLHGLNGSGRSPRAWDPEMFARYDAMPETGWATVTVPGAVSAWTALSGRFGKLPFERLFEPAVAYAREGFHVTPRVADQWAEAPRLYRDFPDFAACFLPSGKAPRAGDLFRCPLQADTLAEIAETRERSFYHGRLAGKIADHAAATGGWITREDLAGHEAEWVRPLMGLYREIAIWEIPPNGQGIAALTALGILRRFDVARYAMDSADSLHLQIEAMKIAFSDVSRHVADPGAMGVDPARFLEEDYLERRAGEIIMTRAGHPPPGLPGDGGTVYLSAADESGMMVSYIQSNYFGFGSGIVVPGTGISLQNRGRGFTLEPGHPNRIAGGKRPFHTIIPGFATRNGLPLWSFGVMGAHMQPQGHVQMVLRCLDYGLNPQAALDAPRWHVFPDYSVALEPGYDPAVVSELARRGHRIVDGGSPGLFGGGQIIERLPDGYCAASDPRKDGQAVGF